jgi:hypothetical protein
MTTSSAQGGKQSMLPSANALTGGGAVGTLIRVVTSWQFTADVP